MSTSDDQLNAALATALEHLNTPVKARLGTWAGYAGGIAGPAAWVIQQSSSWHLPPWVQAVLLGGGFLLTGVTTLGRQIQASSKTKGQAAVASALATPVPPPPALVLSGSAGPMTVSPAPGGLPTPDEVLA